MPKMRHMSLVKLGSRAYPMAVEKKAEFYQKMFDSIFTP